MKVIEGNVASPLGFSADGLHAGFKKRKLDFGWIVSEVPASVAGVYTTNKVIAAPLIVTRNSIKKVQKMKAIVVNSGVANSCTGVQGMEDAYTMQKWTAEKLGVEPDLVGIASTGVIGDLLPMDTLKTGLSKLVVNGNFSTGIAVSYILDVLYADYVSCHLEAVENKTVIEHRYQEHRFTDNPMIDDE